LRADHDHVLAPRNGAHRRPLRRGKRRPIEAVDAIHVERAPLRSRRDEQRLGDHVLAVVEIDPHHSV
jgi:hypothetical protein